MCIIIAKEKNKEFNKEKLDFAYESNKDGCGVMWYDESKGGLQIHRTLSYTKFKEFLDANDWFKDYNAVIHLRYTTVGETIKENCHPFRTNGGAIMHNGTIYSLKPKTDEIGSDSQELAKMLKGFETVEGISMYYKPSFRYLFEKFLGSINRVVFMDKQGYISIFNEDLGIWDNGLWYSNDYFKKKRYVASSTTTVCGGGGCATPSVSTTSVYDHNDVWFNTSNYTTPEEAVKECDKVFVYGTLKKGFSNHSRLKRASFINSYITLDKFAMIGNGLPFPYLITEDSSDGHNVKGEVYKVDKHTMTSLDTLEGYPYHYDRKLIQVVPKDGGTPISAWVYFSEDTPYNPTSCIEKFIK